MTSSRREFVQSAVGMAALGLAAGGTSASPQPGDRPDLPQPTSSRLPRWRGFNLTEMYDANHSRPFRESDFHMIAGWGFNFVRLPMSYLCWTDPGDWANIREEPLRQIDQVIEFGRQYGVHTNLNLHRAPGYCVNPPKEPMDLWTNPEAL